MMTKHDCSDAKLTELFFHPQRNYCEPLMNAVRKV